MLLHFVDCAFLCVFGCIFSKNALLLHCFSSLDCVFNDPDDVEGNHFTPLPYQRQQAPGTQDLIRQLIEIARMGANHKMDLQSNFAIHDISSLLCKVETWLFRAHYYTLTATCTQRHKVKKKMNFYPRFLFEMLSDTVRALKWFVDRILMSLII